MIVLSYQFVVKYDDSYLFSIDILFSFFNSVSSIGCISDGGNDGDDSGGGVAFLKSSA